MKVVLDTNVLLIAVSRKSRFHKIFSSLVDGEYTICITDDILFEYEEILKKYLDGVVAESIMEIFENAQNVIWINKYFKWNLITEDPDDNKFVDCAIACGAQFLVSNDKHFNILKKIKFPKVNVVKAEDFLKTLK